MNIYKWTTNKIKRFWKWLLLLLIPIAMATPLVIPESVPPHVYQLVQWNKPTTDAEWAEDVKKESLHLKFDYQLDEMEISQSAKIPKVQKDLDKFIQCPDCIKWELKEQFSNDIEFGLLGKFEGKTLNQWVDGEFAEQLAYYEWKTDKLNQSVERIQNEKRLRTKGFLTVLNKNPNDKRFEQGTPESRAIKAGGSRLRAPIGTTYYIDADCGTPGDGTTATCNGDADDSYDELDDFTEVSRSAGDIVIVRRGTSARVDNGSDLLFTSSGTQENPIVIEATYTDDWGDDVNLSATGTATLTFGSKTVTFSADISGVLAVGDWIYEVNDAQKDFAYEVETVSTTTATLFLPYKGNNAGSGKTMTNMQSAPKWNTPAGNFQWNFDNDDYWKVQGIHISGTDLNGNIEIDDSAGQVLRDCILEANGFSDASFVFLDGSLVAELIKCRIFNYREGISLGGGGEGGFLSVRDSLFDGNDTSSSRGLSHSRSVVVSLEENEFKNHTLGDVRMSLGFGLRGRYRNNIMSSAIEIADHDTVEYNESLIEDHDGVPNDTRLLSNFSTAEGTPVYQSDTGTLRSGGSNISMKVTPSTKISTNWNLARVKLLDMPFYATTDSKTYTVWFKTNATADWTADPTASELWCELEAWGSSSPNHRKITKSTGVIDFNGSTAWQSLTVTVAPAQAGVAYLRCYYAKTKETPSNIFYVDPLPEVS